jgi:hypothetical protein
MNKNILKDIFKLKIEIMDGITEYLPSIVKGRLYSLQEDLFVAFSEATNEYLEKKKPDDDSNNKHIKTVPIE